MTSELTSDRIKLPDSLEAVNDYLYEQCLTDGLPVVPPTAERVQAMLEYTDRDPGDVIADIAPLWAEGTVEKIAIQAVMAGCLPEYFPVVITGVQALADEAFDLYGRQATTNPIAPMALINGPIRHELDVNFGSGALGPGRRANATIGRALRLVMLNLGGGTPGVLDMSTMGQPAKYGACIGENEEANPWEPFHVENGFPRETSVLSIIPITGTLNILDTESKSAASLLRTLAGSMAIQGTNNQFFGGRDWPMLCLCPEHAGMLAADGYSKSDVRQYLWDHATIPLSAYSPEVGKSIVEKYNPCPEGITHFAAKPEDLLIIVAGGTGPHSIFMPTTSKHALRPVTRKDGTPIKSVNELKRG
ncbi:MAG: hypothetical protein HYX92_10825 [Chloroflexi bacterium]|nr:hypothetical protein [Chloroflexota bacterium]